MRWGIGIGTAAVVVLCFVVRDSANAAMVELLALLEAPAYLRTYGPIVDYRFFEIMSRAFVLIALLASVDVYLRSASQAVCRLALLTGLFGVVMYAGDAGFILDMYELWVGVGVGVALLVMLIARREWLALWTFLSVGLVLGAASIGDWYDDHRYAAVVGLSARTGWALSTVEEELELIGVALYAVVALWYRQRAGRTLAARDVLVAGRWILPILMVSYGNALQHYQYDPGSKTLGLALCLVLAGSGWLLWGLRRGGGRMDEPRTALAFGYIVLFVLMPTLYGSYSSGLWVVHLLLWFPLMFGYYRYLARRAPMATAEREAQVDAAPISIGTAQHRGIAPADALYMTGHSSA